MAVIAARCSIACQEHTGLGEAIGPRTVEEVTRASAP
jgi:hypothetical protein